MSEKIVLIDGHSIIHRAFYGVPDLTSAEGLHTNGIYGFLNIMFRILDEEKPDYLAVAFDLSAPTFRHQMYEAYKGTRKAMPEELREQVPVLKELLSAMKIPLLMQEGYEADDLLGTAAKKSEARGLDTVIVSGDRDLLQIATDRIMIRMPKTRKGVTEIENYHAEDVKAAYQVTPAQIIELKALMGDASDNIPGVPGIGEKGATTLVVAYGSIENAYAHLEEIRQKRTREALREHYDMAVMSKKLATICVEAPVELDLEAARVTDPYTPEAYEWCRRLNFRKYLERFEKKGTQMPKEAIPEAVQIRDLTKAEQIFSRAREQERIAFELNWQKREDGLTLTLSESGYAMTTAEQELHISLALSETEVFDLAEGGFLTETYLLDQMKQVVEAVPFCAASDVKKILRHICPYKKEHLFDIEIAAYLVNPLSSQYAHEDLGRPCAALTTWKRASVLLKQLEDTFAGEIALVFQPGEEYGRGAILFIRDGALKGADRSFGIHMQSNLPVGQVAMNPGAENASVDHFTIRIQGKSAHVSTPELGADALYAAAQIVTALQGLVGRLKSPTDPALIGVGVLRSGEGYNIVAKEAVIEGTVRCFSEQTRAMLNGKIADTARSVAALYNTTAEIETESFTRALINDARVYAETAPVIEKAVGKGNLVAKALSLGGDDMAEIIAAVPGVYAFVGSGSEAVPGSQMAHHTPGFDIDERCLPIAASLYVESALFWLKQEVSNV